MIVVDASVLTLALLNSDVEPRSAAARNALRRDPSWTAPAHWHVETIAALRGLWLGAKIDEVTARRAVTALARLSVASVDTRPLAPRIWELRANLSAYDAAYVAVAEARGAAFITADGRASRPGVARCEVRVVGGDG